MPARHGRDAAFRLVAAGATRRGFLRLVGQGTALAALGQLRGLSPAVAAAAADAPERCFDAAETEILTQLVERLVDTGEPDAPRVRNTRTIATIDALCAQLDPSVTAQLSIALRLFEYGPFVFELRFSRFTRMDDAEKDASLEGWQASRLALRRHAFLALRNLAMLGYYSQPETWSLIGYAGPLIGRSATT